MIARCATLILLLVSLCANGLAQASFGGECSGSENSLAPSLQMAVKKHRIGTAYQDCDLSDPMCRGSFTFDLDRDDRMEYFVRLGCGATGNCTYGIFETRRSRLIGTLTAWFFWIEQSNGPWPNIITYEREGGDQGYVQTYVFRRGTYRPKSGRTEKFSSSEKSFPEKMGMPDCS